MDRGTTINRPTSGRQVPRHNRPLGPQSRRVAPPGSAGRTPGPARAPVHVRLDQDASYTANIVKIYRSIGIAKPRRRIPQQIRPKAIQRQYARQIISIMDMIREALQPLINEVPELLRTAAIDRRMDAGEGRYINTLTDLARTRLRSSLTNDRLESLAVTMANRTSSYQKDELGRQVRAALGVDIIAADTKLRPILENFVATSVSKIKGLPDKVISSVESTILDGVQKGLTSRDLAKTLAKTFNIEEKRANRIARDQIGTLYGQLNVVRQQEIGIQKFIWRTVKDERVRSEHEEREGQIYSYDDPPDGEYPGEPIGCRCYPEPDFTGIFSAMGG